MSTPAPELSIIVASYNTVDFLRPCLSSVQQATPGMQCETIVVDNNSNDGSVAMVEECFPWVRVLRNQANEGFSKANNRALQEARGEAVLLLNPDTLLPLGTLQRLLRVLRETPQVGVLGCRIVRPDGSLDEACKRSFPTPLSALSRFLALDRIFPRSRRFGAYRRTYEDPCGSYEVESIVGAFMLVRRSALECTGGLDEDYFMYGEDIDWCWRLRQHGFVIWYIGDVSVVHHKGASTSTEPQRMNWHFHRSMFLFHRKHLVNRYPFFVNWLVYLGITASYALRSLRVALRPPRRARPLPAGSVA
ncbi:MAG: glycosyltransferase family 2 protein [Planctomycetes bacterium]|nr:glycosyltransferase family 2 protein [Planctomycetota bacterium]